MPLIEELLQRGVPLALAFELFRIHAVSLGSAGRIARLAYIEFVKELGRLGIPAVDDDPAELEEEPQTLG